MLPGLVLGVLFALGLVLVLIWIALPFALFGLKGRLEAIRDEQRRTRELLERVLASRSAADPPGADAAADGAPGPEPVAFEIPTADDDQDRDRDRDRREEPRLPGVWER